MKHFIYALGLSALVLTTSCSKKGNYTEEEKLVGDSISMAMGKVMGARLGESMRQQAMMNPEMPGLDVSKVVRGMEAVLYADTADQSYLTGISIGMNIMQQVMQMKTSNIPSNPELIIRAFKQTVDNDSANAQEYMNEFQAQNSKIQAIAERRAAEERAIQGEANGKAGQAYVDSVRAANDSVQVSESGLAYIIQVPGEEPKVTKENKIMLNYKGMTIDGKVFDQTNGVPREMSAGGFISGFTEGILMLGKGGKATLFIPGELAYGEQGVPRIGIGPNSTLVFEVEVVDILPAE